MWEDLLVKLKLENKENAVSEINLSSNKNNVDQFIECAKRNEQTLFGNIRKSDFHVASLQPGRTRSVISETPPNDCMESHNLYENHTDKVSTVTKNSQQVKGHYGVVPQPDEQCTSTGFIFVRVKGTHHRYSRKNE